MPLPEVFRHPTIAALATRVSAVDTEAEPVLVADPAAQLTAAQVQTLLRTKLAKYEIPACIEFRDALPLNANNKVQKKQLKEELTARLETEPKE